MELIIAAYKGNGRWTDRFVRRILSVRHGEQVSYSHVELLAYPPQSIFPGSKTLAQGSLAASKRDGCQVRFKQEMVFKPGHWDFVDLNVSGAEGKRIWEEAVSQIGIPYDILGAILCVTPFARLALNKEWCSGMIADIANWEHPETFDPHMVVQKAIQLGGELVEG